MTATVPHAVVPKSALTGIRWPAVPSAIGSHLLALQFQFEQSERWPGGLLRQAQQRQLERLLAHAAKTVPFYRERLGGIDARELACPERYSQLPLLRRRDIQERHEDLRSLAAPRKHGNVSAGLTSGSTGQPIRFLQTELTLLFWHAFTLREHLWHRRDFAGKLGAIRSRVKAGSAHEWGPSTDPAFHTGPSATCGTEVPVGEQAQWLMRENPDYLISVASNVQELARYCGEHGLRPSRLREVRTYGEALHPDARKQIDAAWGVPVTDVYSCREVGYLAMQCPHDDHYHVQSEGVWLEIIDATGNPCAPGEVGRVVVTSLHNFAMPLIRYEIGDYAEAGAPCHCGRGLPVINRILGRVRNMLRLPNGDMRYPRFGEAQFGKVAPVRQFQVIQKTVGEIEVNLVTNRPLSGAEEGELRALILQNLAYPFELRFVYRDAIARADSGKYEDFRSEVVG